MFRVADLEKSLAFYRDILGMQVLRREDFKSGRFTLVFLGYGKESSNTVIELTHNWDDNHYQHGNAFGHLALEVEGIYKFCEQLEQMGVKISRKPGPMLHKENHTEGDQVIAFIKDPDGYSIELIDSEYYQER